MTPYEAEQTIIANIFAGYDDGVTEEILASIRPEYFGDSTHQAMFLVALETLKKYGRATASMLSPHLQPKFTEFAHNIGRNEPAILLLIESHKRRKVDEYCQLAQTELMAGEVDAVLSSLQSRLDALNMATIDEPRQLASHIDSLVIDLKKGNERVVKTGIIDFDNKMGAFRPGQMVVIAARPGMGKTILGTQIALYNALNGIPTLYLSLEMSGDELAGRIVAGSIGIDSASIQNRNLNHDEWKLMEGASDRMADIPMFIHDKATVSIASMRAVIRKYVRSHDVGAVVIDYIGLVSEPKDKGENREQQVSRISRFCKLESKESHIPIFVLAQLNRENEKRGDKRPILSDLRESGSIEQDADTVMFLHRPDIAGTETYPDGSSTENIVEIIVAKRRGGRTGMVKAIFSGSEQLIKDKSYGDPNNGRW
jgi:replicative DNA helicase